MTHRFPVTACSQCGQQFGPGDGGYSACSEHRDPEPARVVGVHVSGAEFVVAWDVEPADECEHHHYLGTLGRSKPTVWVDRVRHDGQWFDTTDVFSDDFQQRLNRALIAMPEFAGCEIDA